MSAFKRAYILRGADIMYISNIPRLGDYILIKTCDLKLQSFLFDSN